MLFYLRFVCTYTVINNFICLCQWLCVCHIESWKARWCPSRLCIVRENRTPFQSWSRDIYQFRLRRMTLTKTTYFRSQCFFSKCFLLVPVNISYNWKCTYLWDVLKRNMKKTSGFTQPLLSCKEYCQSKTVLSIWFLFTSLIILSQTYVISKSKVLSQDTYTERLMCIVIPPRTKTIQVLVF